MNGQGQSDRPVVPTKSPNNTGRPGAEEMEGRGLAKGNPRQQNAPRTLSRDGALSALERVREAAERDKQVRFTALLVLHGGKREGVDHQDVEAREPLDARQKRQGCARQK